MISKRTNALAGWMAAGVFLLLSTPAWATFHTFRINEVFSNADGTIQFIELTEVFGLNHQHLFAGQTFTTNAHSYIYPSNLPNSSTADKSFIMATAAFAALPGSVTPDYVIPDSFFSTSGDTLTLVGADSLVIGPVPTDGVMSLNRNGSTGVNSPTNYAGQTGSIDLSSVPIQKGFITIELEPVATGLISPVYATHSGDGSGRLFVVDQAGPIRIISDGELLPTPFLDLTSVIPTLSAGFDERGVLGLAFHPNYASNGRFVVRYSKPRTGDSSEPCFGTSRGCHTEVLAEFSVSNDPNVANPTPTEIFTIDEPQFNHNAGQVEFGPDGYLYFSLGDGGGAHDGLADDPPSHGPDGNGQNIETALGSLLRIDIDGSPPYEVPADNPFVGVTGLDEIYAYGFRNPYRFSFDDAPGGTNELWLADVGQARIEEIDIVDMGMNYGWVIKEGSDCFDPFNPSTPPASCNDAGLIDPVAEYTHEDGLAVVGGFVYRGSQFPELVGKYVFGDFSRDFGPTGRLFYLDSEGDRSEILEFMITGADVPLGLVLKGIGKGEDGELYALVGSTAAPTGTSGQVLRIRRGPDEDLDGVLDGDDLCQNTVPGATVDAAGCPPDVPGDFDGDGDVDQDDVNAFEQCASGPAIPIAPECEDKDLDDDGDGDQGDLGIIQGCLSGEDQPADPGCAG